MQTQGISSEGGEWRRGSGRGGNWGRGGMRRGRGGTGDYNGSQNNGKPRKKLTHFLAIPLGHIPELRTRVSSFTSSLLTNSPSISGLDESIVIPARRLHLTLGVMSLSESESEPSLSSSSEPSTSKTLSSALALLASLKPRLLPILDGNALSIPLEIVDTMKPIRGEPTNAHVMFAGPDAQANGEGIRRLRAFCELINKEFVQAGLVEDDHRPLKLHCTLLNTVYRKPRARDGRRFPFDFTGVITSEAFQRISPPLQRSSDINVETESDDIQPVAFSVSHTHISSNSNVRSSMYERRRGPHRVNLGTYTIDEVQICLMGSWGPEGEYVSVGNINITS